MTTVWGGHPAAAGGRRDRRRAGRGVDEKGRRHDDAKPADRRVVDRPRAAAEDSSATKAAHMVRGSAGRCQRGRALGKQREGKETSVDVEKSTD